MQAIGYLLKNICSVACTMDIVILLLIQIVHKNYFFIRGRREL